jgi:hypothetical protein
LLYLNQAQGANAGSYDVVITGASGSVTSQSAVLTVDPTSSTSAPVITYQPSSQTVAVGSTTAFTVGTSPATPLASFQWFFNGTPILGAVQATYVLNAPTSANNGSYSCLVTANGAATLSQSAQLTVIVTNDPGRGVNLSARGMVAPGLGQMTAGFIIGGAGSSGSTPILIRASGPALGAFGIGGYLPDPILKLDQSGQAMMANSGWAGNPQILATASNVGAFPWTNPASGDSALLTSLSSGAFTAVVGGATGDGGIALVEIYEAAPPSSYTATSPRLVNLSALCTVGTGNNVLVAGFVVGGSTSKTFLIRASGPALSAFGVSGVLPDPQMQIFGAGGQVIAANSSWGGDSQIAAAAATVSAFAWTR